ncbi:MAG: phosphatidate cytidylyltransferase [Gammaproteobacteria bacterium]
MTPLLRRVLTAGILLAAFVAAVVWAPSGLWAVLMAAIVGLAAHEWAHVSQFPLFASRLYATALTGVTLLLPFLLPEAWHLPVLVGLLVPALIFWLVIAPLWLIAKWRAPQVFVRAAMGVVLLLPTWAALLYLHARGPVLLLGVLAIVWIADTAAYFSGRRFGRHKLAPAISPGKTWEGVAGAWGALALYAVGVAFWTDLDIVPLVLLMSGLLYFSVLGDLFESWIKRVAGMKDSGSILPGHGGVLDRVDALTSTLPLAMAILMWLEYSL